MAVVLMLMIASISVAGAFLLAYLWSVSDGQMDDMDSPAYRILMEETPLDNN